MLSPISFGHEYLRDIIHFRLYNWAEWKIDSSVKN